MLGCSTASIRTNHFNQFNQLTERFRPTVGVRIRLKKMGHKHRPYFRICAMDARAPRDGRAIEELGTYDPMVPETDARAILNGERIQYWLGVGAQPTPKVGTLIKKYGKDGTHLAAQAEAIARLSERRAASIRQARDAAISRELPKIEQPAPPSEAPADSPENATETAEAAQESTGENNESAEEATA